MHRLHRLKIVFTGLALLIGLSLMAQNFGRGSYNFLDYQSKPYYFGITLGYNTSNFKVFRSTEFLQTDSIARIESATGPGFNLGIVTNLKLGDYFDLRFLPTLSFASKSVQYDRFILNSQFSQRTVEQVMVEFPIHVRYKSAPYKDKRFFIIAGVKYAFDVASESRARQADELVKISPTDFALEYGAGIQFFFPYFIFSPEFKISHGLGNGLIYNKNLIESTVLEKILSRTFTISLHFEG